MPPVSRILVLLLGIAPGLPAQAAHSGAGPRARVEGKWQAKTEDEIRNIIVRSDSSAQFVPPAPASQLIAELRGAVAPHDDVANLVFGLGLPFSFDAGAWWTIACG